MYSQFYKDKMVIITGHTGFKGSWLAIWLKEMGAKVIGIALDPFSEKDNYVLSNLNQVLDADLRIDIRNLQSLKTVFHQYKPDIVFHLAAQPLVRLSYLHPIETYETNVMGTIHVMEAIRETESVKVGVMITTDKCYENKEQLIGYKETDALGGYDPYSSSKGAAEIAIASWRNSFFNPETYEIHGKSIASVRAGNVIGGGDWAIDRLIPDCIRALESNKEIVIRSPKSVRPWQHVLEPLDAYLLLAKKMWEEPKAFSEAWNFGPELDRVVDVQTIAEKLIKIYSTGKLVIQADAQQLHEANLLLLDISKAKEKLNWKPKLNFDETMHLTVDWYKRYQNEDVFQLCVEQIKHYQSL